MQMKQKFLLNKLLYLVSVVHWLLHAETCVVQYILQVEK